MIMTTWGCKACLLLMYNKLTFGLKQQLAVKIIGAYVVGGLVLMEILYFGVWCRPFHNYWAVPTPNSTFLGSLAECPTDDCKVQCSAALHHLTVNACLNISSDLLMLSIPLPLLITSKLPRTKYVNRVSIPMRLPNLSLENSFYVVYSALACSS